ncbi:MAG: geranylgeranyl reductase family protein [Candidatus Thorarchaeota archaeon]|jgi:digeranylgeranylglycerophospholipid reductase
MSNNSYDIAVVGAGPAGCTAARVTAEKGFKTVVVERRRQVGVPVQCGEYLPLPSEMSDLLRDSPRAARLVDVPKRLVTNCCDRLRLFSPFGRSFEFRLQSNVIDRAQFDQYLAEQAADAGAEFRLETMAVRRTESNHLTLRGKNGNQEISARIVIGADGPRSLISQSIGNRYDNEGRDLCPSLNFVMENVDCNPATTEMYFGRQIAPGGYAWIIPKGEDTANVGFGLRWPFGTPGTTLKQYLYRFIKTNPLLTPRTLEARITSRVGATIPVGGPVERTFSDNVVLVGDAAGHVMACNGGGIPTALAGGEIAGEAVGRHLTEGEPLSCYEDDWRREFGTELYTALRILRIADQVMESDRITDQCMRLAGPRYLKHLIRCRLPFPVDLASKTLVKMLAYFE